MPISATSIDLAVLDALGARIERTRLERNLTQNALATEAGVSKTTIERLEAGRGITLANFVRVLRALGLLDGLDHLVPEPLPSPIEELRREGKRRQRASGSRRPRDPEQSWTWADPEADA